MSDTGRPAAPVIVEFQPFGRRVPVAAGTTLLQAARDGGVSLLSVCGGAGICDSCRVQVIRGEISAISEHERDELPADEIAAGYRLACQAGALGDAVVQVPVESMGAGQRLQLECDAQLAALGSHGAVVVEPVVTARDVTLPAPSRNDLRADTVRLRDALATGPKTGGPTDVGLPRFSPGAMLRDSAKQARLRIPAALLASLPSMLRDHGWAAKLVLDEEQLRAVLPCESRLLGVAVDVGTTKIAAYLIDLQSGDTLAAEGAVNPQVSRGEDVISRIAYADATADGAVVMHRLVIQAVNDLVASLCVTAGVARDWIVDAVLVGNTVMHHLACGLPVASLGRAPYVPVVSEAVTLPASDLGLDFAPGARVYLPPNLAGYVGADHVAVLTAVGEPGKDHTRLVIDIGTNTEISLLTAGRIVSCSCASGPAFEGAHITCGMRAVTGAIERVRVIGDAVRYQTIGGAPPIGICGSGVLDAVAELFTHGALDRHGGFRRDHPLIASRGNARVLVLASADATGHNRELVLTRHDVTEIQLAKAAIRTGVNLLLERANLCAEAVDEVVVAGAFGSYIDLASARRIGMLPDLSAGRFRQVGNAAGAGARNMLVSAGRRREAEHVAGRVEYLDLTADPHFTEAFAAALGF